MASILDNLQKKKTGKRDKLFLIPIISIVLSISVFALFMWLRNQDEKPAVIEEPWSRVTTQHVADRMIDNNDSFLLYIYADWCPYCKETMFGADDATSGEGTLKKWYAEDNPDMDVYFEREEEVDERSDDLNAFMNDLKFNKIAGENADRWEWAGKEYEYSTEGGVYKLKAEQDETDKERPGVPGFIMINDGYTTGFIAGGQSLVQFKKLYEQLVVDANDCYQKGIFVSNGDTCK